MQNILVVSDDAILFEKLRAYLVRFEFLVHRASDLDSTRKSVVSQSIQLVILDKSPSGEEGVTLLRDIRANSRIPIVILSGNDDSYDLVLAFELGADDYLSKPFEPRVLLARLKALLRRVDGAQTQLPDEVEVIHFDEWQLNRVARNLIRPDGVVTQLTNAEFSLLSTFLSMPRRICSRERLMEDARGRTIEAYERSIDLLVSRLRHKMRDDPRQPKIIKTIRGAGYLLNVQTIHGRMGWLI